MQRFIYLLSTSKSALDNLIYIHRTGFWFTESSLSDLTLHSLPPSNENQRSKCSPNTSERGSVKSIPGARGSPDSYSNLPKKSNSTSQLSATGKFRKYKWR